MLGLPWEHTVLYESPFLKKCWLTLQLHPSPSPDCLLFWNISDVRDRMGLSLELDPLGGAGAGARRSAVMMFSRTHVDGSQMASSSPGGERSARHLAHVCLCGHLPWSQGKLGAKSGGRKSNARALGRKPGRIRKRSGITEGWR